MTRRLSPQAKFPPAIEPELTGSSRRQMPASHVVAIYPDPTISRWRPIDQHGRGSGLADQHTDFTRESCVW
jgi:hypothetical protein